MLTFYLDRCSLNFHISYLHWFSLQNLGLKRQSLLYEQCDGLNPAIKNFFVPFIPDSRSYHCASIYIYIDIIITSIIYANRQLFYVQPNFKIVKLFVQKVVSNNNLTRDINNGMSEAQIINNPR